MVRSDALLSRENSFWDSHAIRRQMFWVGLSSWDARFSSEGYIGFPLFCEFLRKVSFTRWDYPSSVTLTSCSNERDAVLHKREGKRKKKIKCYYICISPQWWGWLRFLPVMKLVYELFPSVRSMIAPECRARRLNSYKFSFLFAGESVSCCFTLCWWVRSYQ